MAPWPLPFLRLWVGGGGGANVSRGSKVTRYPRLKTLYFTLIFGRDQSSLEKK